MVLLAALLGSGVPEVQAEGVGGGWSVFPLVPGSLCLPSVEVVVHLPGWGVREFVDRVVAGCRGRVDIDVVGRGDRKGEGRPPASLPRTSASPRASASPAGAGLVLVPVDDLGPGDGPFAFLAYAPVYPV